MHEIAIHQNIFAAVCVVLRFLVCLSLWLQAGRSTETDKFKKHGDIVMYFIQSVDFHEALSRVIGFYLLWDNLHEI